MAKLPTVNIGFIGGKSSKFRLPYSQTPDFQIPDLIPRDKRMGELTIGIRYAEFLIRNNVAVNGVRLNDDDSNGKADVLLFRENKTQGIQITRLTFTEYERRKAIHAKKVIGFVETLQSRIQIDFQLIIQIFPRERFTIPLIQLKRNKQSAIEQALIDFVVTGIQSNLDRLKMDGENVPLHHLPSDLRHYFSGVNLLAVPMNYYPNVPGGGNFYIDYKFYDSAYDDNDIEKEVGKIYRAKNGASAEVLIIWANGYELLDEGKIVRAFRSAFEITSFHEVYFLVSQADGKLYPIKGSPV